MSDLANPNWPIVSYVSAGEGGVKIKVGAIDFDVVEGIADDMGGNKKARTRPINVHLLDGSGVIAARAITSEGVQLSSCVPATGLEASGARLTASDLVAHRGHPQVIGLAEFMNAHGVLAKDRECLDKLAAFQDRHIDGHSPLLSGKRLNAYLACGVRNCHETTSFAEGREKIAKGRC